ncbi:MAG TPA: type II toxin-antitoxin system VapC family toxin [Desulfuromonadales bacterium]|nr:type II toxin-antitoxin system VapC family toxin [Desulfuromonadales bacterium]
MESIVLDTNVISELMRSSPDQAVIDWFANRTDAFFYISAITQAEIMLGIAVLPAGKRRESLANAANLMFTQEFAGKCLPFDAAAAVNYSILVSNRRRSGHATTTEDAMIASIAMAHGCSLATRNIKDFLFISGLTLLNPWQK